MITYNFNPHSTHSGSNRVKSQVVSLALKDNSGGALAVSDLPSNIQINIPFSEAEPGNTSRLDYFLNPGDLQYHVIKEQEVHTTIKVSLKTKTPAFVTGYVKFGEKPTEYSYDEIVELSEGNGVKNEQPDCLSTESCSHSILIHCNFSGDYYIGLLLHRKSDTVHPRSKRALLLEKASQRKCVRFKDPPPTVPPPVESTVILPQYDPETSVNYSLIVESIWCAYWSDAEERWTNDGCKVRKIRLALMRRARI